MLTNQTIWYLTTGITILCFLLAYAIYVWTGDIAFVIFLAPLILHWIMRKRLEDKPQDLEE